MKKLLIVDGNSIINRAFYAIRPLTTSEGIYTNAIFGTINILCKHLDAVHPDRCAVAFDLPSPTFRHKMYKEYKAGRRASPEELKMQFDYAKECIRALGFTVVTCEGYEADDILGTLSQMAHSCENTESYIVTGDRDALQLIDDTTTVLLETNKGTVKFDRAHFIEEYGVDPSCFIDVKALMGDSSDNIPGVPGIGQKTALKIISEYGSVANLYSNLDKAKFTPSVRSKLESGRESAEMSRELATICRSAPGLPEIESLGDGHIDNKAAYDIFTKLEFSGFIKKFNLENSDEKNSSQETFETVSINEERLKSIKNADVAFEINSDNKIYIFDGEKVSVYEGDLSYIEEFLSVNNIICYDCKRIYKLLNEFDIMWRGCRFDVMLAAYVVNSGDSSFNLQRIVMEYLNTTVREDVPEVVYIYRLKEALSRLVSESGQEKLLYEIEIPLASVLADMENNGFCIDCEGIKEYGRHLGTVAVELEQRIYYYAAGEFNINSPKQLGEVLFERMGLPHGKKTKTGYSTSADILEKLRPYHPIIEEILDYRQVTKLKSTYVDGLLKVADGECKVHTNFKQTGTATGRLSSTEPNLQNIPVRTELGRELRRYFIPKKQDYILIDADYSQIELRLLAAISDDKNMTESFLNGKDIHASTAAKVFNVSIDEVTPELRKRAKAVNFGIMYGIGEYSLSRDLGISIARAKKYISDYLASYPAIDAYLKETVSQAYENGYVTTIFGRRRYIPELKSPKKPMRAFGERVAMNSPIQGSAADIIKIAMINVDKKLKQSGVDAHLILQVHDELMIESHKDCAEKAFEILKEEMEGAVRLSVPLNVDTSSGKTWFECK